MTSCINNLKLALSNPERRWSCATNCTLLMVPGHSLGDLTPYMDRRQSVRDKKIITNLDKKWSEVGNHNSRITWHRSEVSTGSVSLKLWRSPLTMQPPLPRGTLLQNRYRIDRVLGSGGFGRTYIAEDSNMYDELCVLKEYNPSVQGTYAMKKSKELFEREAKILYQIKHPQIPKFRATFEQGKRLFLLQDYVKGKTYRSLLDARLANNEKFSQKEVVEFLEQMLPVLTYIHSKDIIHRDISPDNIILPDRTSPEDQQTLPVLIDFGAVKEIGEKGAGESEGSVQGTTVGKLGYSPPEQLQTGKVAPNSDLYALAATAIVLMTGRKPEELLNEDTMMPCWSQWVPTLDSRLSLILNKMMSYRPENRYQSASDAFNALRSSKDLMFQEQNTSLQQEVQGKPPKQATPSQNNRETRKKTPPSLFKNLLNHPLTSKVMGGGLVFLVTVAVSLSLRPPANRHSEPSEGSSPPSEEISTSPEETNITPISSPDSTRTPTMEIKRNMFAGDTVNEANRLQADDLHRYHISGTPGKLLSVKLLTGGVEMKVLDSNEQPMNKEEQAEWQGTMLSEGVYIDICSVEEIGSSKYELEISVKEP